MICIIPAAGKSSGFPNLRPRWSLTHPNGDCMLVESLKGLPLDSFTHIYLTFLKEHIVNFKLENTIRKNLDKLNIPYTIIVLDNPTTSQAATVYETIVRENITGTFFIKDTDNYFSINSIAPNSICIYNLAKCKNITAGNKSYVEINKEGIINNVIEKKIISTYFSTGGYCFRDTETFKKTFERLQSEISDLEIFISHVIFDQILNGEIFVKNEVENYCDWGTIADWNKFKKDYKSIFIDLDGVLVKNSGEYSTPGWGETEGITENINYINKLYDTGKCKIIITTSRKEKYRPSTLLQLYKNKIKFHDIIFDLPHCQRLIINDYAESNPYPSCEAINIKRDSNELSHIMNNYFEL